MSRTLSFPQGRTFAFTILDDTDDATLANVRQVYDLLRELGMRTTKTAWPLDCPEGSRNYFAAETLQNPEYLAFVRELIEQGFEFAFHGATMESSTRDRTLAGLRFVREQLGVSPRIHCNHGQNAENLYWGPARCTTTALRLPLAALNRVRRGPRFQGHDPASAYFWGDVAQDTFHFVRSFTFSTVNTLRIAPCGPYRLRSTPYVNYWFNTSDAPDLPAFARLMTPAAIDALERDGGVCILSTHLGKGFTEGGRVRPEFEHAMRDLARRRGWFVPVSDVLEHLLGACGGEFLDTFDRWRLETLHLVDRVRNRLYR